jgi:hypothetical protein
MRTGQIRLGQFLYRRGIPEIEDGDCQRQEGEQTVAVVLGEDRPWAYRSKNTPV